MGGGEGGEAEGPEGEVGEEEEEGEVQEEGRVAEGEEARVWRRGVDRG